MLADHAVVGIPRSQSAESALHMRVDDGEAVDIGRVDPAETVRETLLAMTSTEQ